VIVTRNDLRILKIKGIVFLHANLKYKYKMSTTLFKKIRETSMKNWLHDNTMFYVSKGTALHSCITSKCNAILN
jgi:hypothetical protein